MNDAAATFLALLLAVSTANAGDPGWPVVPNPQLTPGETRDLTVETICATKWGRDERAVTQAMKARVFVAYSIALAARHLVDGSPAFEIDHLVSRELGGADTMANLWPQPYIGPWNARLKDRVENRLHAEVCAGRLALADAQQMIRADWRTAYSRYFGSPK